MSDTTKLTPAAHQKITEQIERLEGEGRREIAARIKTAREWGDLKENAEYHAAKEDAAMLEAKINGLRDQLRSAEIVEASDDGVAGMGSQVTYADEASGKELVHTLVPKIDADPGNGRISPSRNSPAASSTAFRSNNTAMAARPAITPSSRTSSAASRPRHVTRDRISKSSTSAARKPTRSPSSSGPSNKPSARRRRSACCPTNRATCRAPTPMSRRRKNC